MKTKFHLVRFFFSHPLNRAVCLSVTFCLSPYTQDLCPTQGHGGHVDSVGMVDRVETVVMVDKRTNN